MQLTWQLLHATAVAGKAMSQLMQLLQNRTMLHSDYTYKSATQQKLNSSNAARHVKKKITAQPRVNMLAG